MFAKFSALTFALITSVFSQPGYTQSLSDSSQNILSSGFSIINDNYIGRWLPGKTGNYFGADDFLTLSFMAYINYNDWHYSARFSALTSRKFSYRYDLFLISVDKRINFNNFYLKPGGGILYKGKLGGQFIQNSYHDLMSINSVEIPYSKNSGPAAVFQIQAGRNFHSVLNLKDRIHIFGGGRLYSDYLPSWLIAGSIGQFEFYKTFQLELLVSYRPYLNSVKQFSALVNDGFISGINLKYNLYRDWFLDAGFILIPVKNVISDPYYGTFSGHILPQVWLSFSWHTRWKSQLENLFY
jgi:hypothetical protein